ncbi:MULTISPECIES: VWA domain-containing protein [Aphanizomenon]|jgi:uncharacterized protein YegL|uniref:vWA domain-containing protein n=1 Tax=Aphanizomenon TaxID=1175 RepID=UPI000544556B|nr:MULTISPECIES: VWA domain-containing protein [Aphanizomenon]KHG42749.1 von Willebrand factor type A [Aphanizomenon flos-aquae 2012/KM1/D3]MTJ32305.1 VWA domain-containing protein [Aphanizomenon sp. UHCC 0183]QSV70747.1 MAG: VWA domain-containing protein [Aphanizomenon flos-aquae KM1D3_PB]
MSVGKPEYQFPEFVNNPEPRCPVILLLDTSGSMGGEPIGQLNKGIKVFKREAQKDAIASLRIEVSIITFGQTVDIVQDFVTIDEFTPPVLQANGDTPMGQAIGCALNLLEDRKEAYKNNGMQYYQPWVFLITDGAPTDSWQKASQRLQELEKAQRLSFFAVAVEGADMNTLQKISLRPPVILKGLDFNNMFIWLSQSMSRVSSAKVSSGMTDLPPLTWAKVPN